MGVTDNFFELGGDSLKAVNLAARIHKKLQIEIPLGEFFNRPCIELLARYIDETDLEILIPEKSEAQVDGDSALLLLAPPVAVDAGESFDQPGLAVIDMAGLADDYPPHSSSFLRMTRSGFDGRDG